MENCWATENSLPIAKSPDKEMTIDDLATASFVRDLKRALNLVGCTPECLDCFGVSDDDDKHEFIVDGTCFEHTKEDILFPTPGSIMKGVAIEIDCKTVNSSSTQSEANRSTTYESFAEIEAQGNCARSSLLTKCLQPKK